MKNQSSGLSNVFAIPDKGSIIVHSAPHWLLFPVRLVSFLPMLSIFAVFLGVVVCQPLLAHGNEVVLVSVPLYSLVLSFVLIAVLALIFRKQRSLKFYLKTLGKIFLVSLCLFSTYFGVCIWRDNRYREAFKQGQCDSGPNQGWWKEDCERNKLRQITKGNGS